MHFATLVVTETDKYEELFEKLAPFEEGLEIAQEENEDGDYWYNPKAQWDSYSIGGRYNKRLLTLSGNRVNTSKFKDLDLQTMVLETRERRKKTLSENYSFLKFCELWHQNKQRYLDYLEEYRNGDKNKCFGYAIIDKFDSEEAWRDFFNLFEEGKGLDPEEGYDSPEEYIALSQPISAFSFLALDGEWHECKFRKNKEWDRKLPELVKNINPEHWVTIVDIHI